MSYGKTIPDNRPGPCRACGKDFTAAHACDVLDVIVVRGKLESENEKKILMAIANKLREELKAKEAKP